VTDGTEAMAATLEASGDYRVLRRLRPRSVITPADGTPTKRAIFLDVETTGLDPARDEIIELAMVPFTYSADGRIFEVGRAFEQLQQPAQPISAEITALTGIDDALVAGKTIDLAEVRAFAAPASLVIAHNANFDRRFVERLSDVFTTKAWACSMSQVPWAAEGFSGGKLRYLASDMGFFFDGHRAAADCQAAIALLAERLPKSGVLALAALLENARKVTQRIWAEGSPFDLKDILKARGYHWNGDNAAQPKAWYRDVAAADVPDELRFLRTEIYQRDVDLRMTEITAYDRFSVRI
jgi:DNA polymerase-3 subunit epsilon